MFQQSIYRGTKSMEGSFLHLSDLSVLLRKTSKSLLPLVPIYFCLLYPPTGNHLSAPDSLLWAGVMCLARVCEAGSQRVVTYGAEFGWPQHALDGETNCKET